MSSSENLGSFILLTEKQAGQVRGLSSPFHGLDPRKIADDHFILPCSVLGAPSHAAKRAFLSTLPWCEVIRRPDGELEVLSGSIGSGHPELFEPIPYVPKGERWARPPLPQRGDWSEAYLYECIGRALSAWEAYEVSLADLFAAFNSPSLNLMLAVRVYGSITTNKGRIDILETAGEEYFKTVPNQDLYDEFQQVIKNTRNYAARRNEIAHGVVSGYTPSAGQSGSGLALQPPRYATKKQIKDKRWPLDTRPVYAYTSAEVLFFCNEFISLCPISYHLESEIFRYFEE